MKMWSVALVTASILLCTVGRCMSDSMQNSTKIPPHARLLPPEIVAARVAKAGSSWRFRVSIRPVSKIEKVPSKMIVRLELMPHVVFLAQSFDVPKRASAWHKGGPVDLGPFTLRLPADLPKGDYAVQVAVVGEAYAGRSAADLSCGRLKIQGKSTYESTSLKPLDYGTFVDSNGVPHAWHSTAANVLVWDGSPCLYVSGMLNGPYLTSVRIPETFKKFQDNVQAIKKQGLNHVYLTCQTGMNWIPASEWNPIMDYLESQGITYTIGYSWKTQRDLAARPIRARSDIAWATDAILPGEASKQITDSDLGSPVAGEIESCLAIAINANNDVFGPVAASVGEASQGSVTVSTAFTDAPKGNYRIIFLPKLRNSTSSNMNNPWRDREKDTKDVLDYLRQMKFRPGFRGFIDVMIPNERGIHNYAESLFFVDPSFTADRATWLQEKYGDIQQLKKAWALTDTPPSFAIAARLFPAISEVKPGDRLMLLIDPEENKIYRADARQSIFWYEYIDQRDESFGRLGGTMFDAVKEVVDVPIFVKRCGSTERYHASPYRSNQGHDAVGYELYSSGEGLVHYGAGAGYAEMLQSGKYMIGAATELATGYSQQMPANWPNLPEFFSDLSVVNYMGAKINYLFLFDVIAPNYLDQNHLIYDSRMLEWMGLWKRLVDEHSDAIAKHRPIVYTSWPRSDVWWATPSQRRAVRETDDAPGLVPAKAPNGIWVLPVFDAMAPAPVTVVTLADDPAVRYYARDFEKLIARRDRLVILLGLRKNLGALSTDKYFTGEMFDMGGDICQVLKPTRDCKVLEKDDKGRVWALQVGRVQIVARKPKANVTMESVLKFAHVPPVPDTARASAKNYMNKLMGISAVSVGHGRFLGVAFIEYGRPTVVLHSTSRVGNESLTLRVPAGKTVSAIIPADGDKKVEVTGEATIMLRFPPGPGDDLRKGAGKGAVTIVGLKPEELSFVGLESDQVEVSKDAGVTQSSAVPEGVSLPPVIAPVRNQSSQFIDEVKSSAMLEQAIGMYNCNELSEAQRIAEEWIVNASADQLRVYNLLLGNVRIRRGDAEGARHYYSRGLLYLSYDPALRCGLGVALMALGDRDGARREFQAAATVKGPVSEIARRNLDTLK